MTFQKFIDLGFLGSYSAGEGADVTVAVVLMVIGVVVSAVASYLLGSLNWAIIISAKKHGDDIRKHGSGNAGTTNVLRTYGKKDAAITLLGDMLKAVASCLIGYSTIGINGAYLAGLCCILGHMFPIFYKFKGGKGVACAAAVILMCNPFVFLILIAFFAIIVATTKFVSLASVMSVMVYPLLLNRMDSLFGAGAKFYHTVAVIIAILVIFKHKENIKRLYEGKESKISFKSKKPDTNKTENE